jgi:DNA (cytosine-5)-methyltransferase 1
MTFGSLFSGIGGIDLGLERAGMECKWQVEIDVFCRRVLKKHWPDVRRYGDIRTVGADSLEPVDLLAGGFPCQDVSIAGKRAGIKEGTRSGLWSEYYRVICELRPRYVFVENVTGLFIDGMGRVLSDLAEIGYNAEWQVLSAADMGALHLRKRVFIVAYSNGKRCSPFCGVEAISGEQACSGHLGQGSTRNFFARRPEAKWEAEPCVGRVAHGVPRRVDRVKALGNAVVPQCAEYIGRMIMASHN